MQHMLSIIALSSSVLHYPVKMYIILHFLQCCIFAFLDRMLFVCGGRKYSFVISNSEGCVVRAQFGRLQGVFGCWEGVMY